EAASASAEASTSTGEQLKALKDVESATEELAQMAENLKVNTDSEKSSEELASAAEELSATIAQVNAASQQIMAAIRQIAKGAEEQGSATQESSSAIAQIDQIAKDIGRKAKESLEKVEALQKVFTETKNAVDELIEGIGEAAEGSLKSGENIKALEGRMRQIDKIVDAITNVAMQTNLLAVNGGIEAARAGEYGKGFAVVASDIRTLANDSEQNAEKIKDLVRSIQDQVLIVADDIQQTGVSARQEVENAKETNRNLAMAEGDMNEVREGVFQIRNASEEAVAGQGHAGTGSGYRGYLCPCRRASSLKRAIQIKEIDHARRNADTNNGKPACRLFPWRSGTGVSHCNGSGNR
ncbi:MAG: methyl-accepting chemotaxis protein, partial [Deltaproteobacteria bacterium]|nr:methyl-accepting chemotaxis protein [Deltaproteobacteria bacterium]